MRPVAKRHLAVAPFAKLWSFEGAAFRLAMSPVMLRADELQLGRGEAIADTAHSLISWFCRNRFAVITRSAAHSGVKSL